MQGIVNIAKAKKIKPRGLILDTHRFCVHDLGPSKDFEYGIPFPRKHPHDIDVEIQMKFARDIYNTFGFIVHCTVVVSAIHDLDDGLDVFLRIQSYQRLRLVLLHQKMQCHTRELFVLLLHIVTHPFWNTRHVL